MRARSEIGKIFSPGEIIWYVILKAIGTAYVHVSVTGWHSFHNVRPYDKFFVWPVKMSDQNEI